jgi:hypothetical protein
MVWLPGRPCQSMSSKQVCIYPHPRTLTFDKPLSKPTAKPGRDPPSAYPLHTHTHTGNLADLGAQAKGACGSVQLCTGLEAAIEGALHLVRLRAETNGSMLFCAGEIDDDLWELEMEEGEDPPWTAKAEEDQWEECVDGPEGLTH